MNHDSAIVWTTLLLLGAYHGLNPAMGWLFAVARGMQEKRRAAVFRSVVPLALGHAAAIALAMAIAVLAHAVLPLRPTQIVVGLVLMLLGAAQLLRRWHPRWVRMQVGFRDLTLWSFLMASAHGAGLMLVPIFLRVPAAAMPMHHHAQLAHSANAGIAVGLHTTGYLAATVVLAWLTYQYFGLKVLRTAWLNVDVIWAVTLIVAGVFCSLL